jgi:cytochrome b6-f complex iron-sulfur subunit
MADEKDPPTPKEPAPGAGPSAVGAPPTKPPDTGAAHPAGTAAGSTPPVPTPPMTAPTDPAPPRAEGVAAAEPKVPADAKAPEPRPTPPRPATPAAAAAAAPAAVNTKGPSDSATPGGPNPGAEAAARTAAAAAATAAKPPVASAPAPAASARSADEGVSRRGFLKWTTVGWVAFSAACTSGLVASTRFLFPNVLFEPPQAFKVGFPSEYTVGEVDTRWKDAFGVWVVRNSEGFYALIAVCTHLGCSPNWLAAENKFKCPCHGSGFYPSGVNFEGPAPRPLERARIVLADDGQILVDKSVKFQQEKGEWTFDESFLKV